MFQFYFQSGDFFHEPFNFWKDVFIPFAITLAGVFVALRIEWQIDKSRERKQYKDQIDYLKEVLKNIINQSKSQSGFLVEYADFIKTHPENWGLCKLTAENDVERLAVNENQQIFIAFVSVYGSDRSSIGRFKKMYSCIDALYFLRRDFLQVSEKARRKNIDLLVDYRNSLEKLLAAIGTEMTSNRLPPMTLGRIEFVDFLNKTIVEYFQNRNGDTSMEYAQKNFVEPFFERLHREFYTIQFNESLTWFSRELTIKYHEVVRDTSDSADEFLALKENYSQTSNDLQNILDVLTGSIVQTV